MQERARGSGYIRRDRDRLRRWRTASRRCHRQPRRVSRQGPSPSRLDPLLLSDHASVPPSQESRGLVDGIAYANIGRPSGGRVRRLTDRFQRQNRIAQSLTGPEHQYSDVTLLIVHSTLYGRLLQRWADRRHIPVVADLMERHEPMQFTRGRLDPQYLRHRRLSRLCARRPAGLLLISTQLRAVVRPRVPALVVPPFVDTDEFMPSAESAEDAADNLSLAYAGTPNNKDLLGPVVDAIADLDPASRARVSSHHRGPDQGAAASTGRSSGVGPASLRRIG